MLLTVAAIGLTLAMLGLALTSFAYIARNITKIDIIKGKFSLRRNSEQPNPFDLGVISNFSSVFEGHLWSCWWPSRMVPSADGTKFPLIPPVNSEDFGGLSQELQRRLRDEAELKMASSMEEL